MKKLLQNIQNKPEHIRWRILYITFFVCMLVIISIWVASLRENVILGNSSTKKGDSQKIDSPSPFEILKNTSVLFYKDFIGGMKDIKSNIAD